MLNVVIPMAGAGSRFRSKGYTVPKPLIEIRGAFMVQRAVESLGLGDRHIYIAQAEHVRDYNLLELLPSISPNVDVHVVEVDGVTEGAAQTVLMAKKFIDNQDSLIVCNSDQIVEWSHEGFIDDCTKRDLFGSIAVFESTDPKWSFAKTNKDNFVIEVAEKTPISNQASVGFYYWKYGSDYVKYAEQMIEKNLRVNNEFYITPVYSEAISEGKSIGTYYVDKMFGVGTPEDLKTYLTYLN